MTASPQSTICICQLPQKHMRRWCDGPPWPGDVVKTNEMHIPDFHEIGTVFFSYHKNTSDACATGQYGLATL